jgi:DivIVA domain-containing protein
MDVSAKMLREVEFRDRLRGYDTDEVDEFLEKVAIGVDELAAQLTVANDRLAEAQRQQREAPVESGGSSGVGDDDLLRRTLVLAQRTADLAISEAQAEADQLLRHARVEADQVIEQARASALEMRSEAEQGMLDRLARLTSERDDLERGLARLVALVDSERARISESLASLSGVLIDSLTVSTELRSAAELDDPAEPAPLLEEDPADADLDLDLDLGLDLNLGSGNGTRAPETNGSDGGEVHHGFPRSVAPDNPSASAGIDVPEHASSDPDEELWNRWARSAEPTRDSNGEADPFHLAQPDEGRTS